MKTLSPLGPCDIQLSSGAIIWGDCREVLLADQSCIEVICPILNRKIRLAPGSWQMISTIEQSVYDLRVQNPQTLENIKRVVSLKFQCDASVFETKIKTARIVWPRQVAMFLAYQTGLYTMQQVGQSFGGKHYSSVDHSSIVVRNRMATEPDTKKLVAELADILRIKI